MPGCCFALLAGGNHARNFGPIGSIVRRSRVSPDFREAADRVNRQFGILGLFRPTRAIIVIQPIPIVA
jgi:hypothetical protein